MKTRLLLTLTLISILSGIPGSRTCDICAEDHSKCQESSPPRGGFINCKWIGHTKNCVGTCLSGHVFPDGQSRMILECDGKTGVWSPQRNFLGCVREPENSDEYEQEQIPGTRAHYRTCPEITYVRNGYVNCDSGARKCVGTCRSGHAFVLEQGRFPTMELKCADDGRWYPYGRFPDCEKDDDQQTQEPVPIPKLRTCPQLASPRNGAYNCQSYGDQWTCTARCNYGYFFTYGKGRRTTMELECLDNGRWYPRDSFPDCEGGDGSNGHSREPGNPFDRVDRICQAPSPPVNGRINCSFDTSQKTCQAKCNDDYFFPGRRTTMETRCLADTAYWYPYTSFPDCKGSGIQRNTTETVKFDRIHQMCRAPTPPSNGEIHCSFDTTQKTCQARCNDGYFFTEAKPMVEIRCSADNASWYPFFSFPDCKAIS